VLSFGEKLLPMEKECIARNVVDKFGQNLHWTSCSLIFALCIMKAPEVGGALLNIFWTFPTLCIRIKKAKIKMIKTRKNLCATRNLQIKEDVKTC